MNNKVDDTYNKKEHDLVIEELRTANKKLNEYSRVLTELTETCQNLKIRLDSTSEELIRIYRLYTTALRQKIMDRDVASEE